MAAILKRATILIFWWLPIVKDQKSKRSKKQYPKKVCLNFGAYLTFCCEITVNNCIFKGGHLEKWPPS